MIVKKIATLVAASFGVTGAAVAVAMSTNKEPEVKKEHHVNPPPFICKPTGIFTFSCEKAD